MSIIQILVLLTLGALLYVILGAIVEQAGRWYRDRALRRHIAFRKAIVEELREMGYVLDADPWTTGAATQRWLDDLENEQPFTYTMDDCLDDLHRQQPPPEQYKGADWL